MPGNFKNHLDDYGNCRCGNSRSGVENVVLESQDELGRWTTSRYPACADCWGLI